MICKNCGQPIHEDAAFCKNCGAAVVKATDTPPETPAPPPPAEETPAAQETPPAEEMPPAPPPASSPPPPVPPSAAAPPPLPPPRTPQAPAPKAPPVPAPPPRAAQPGFTPGWRPPEPPRQSNRNTGLIIGSVIAAIVVLAGLGVGLYFGLRGDGSEETASSKTTVATSSSTSTSASTSTSTTEAAFAQGEGEIFLEAAGKAGPEPFTGETFVPVGPPPTLNIPTSSTASSTTTSAGTATTQPATATTAAGVQVVSVAGDAPALYGGSKDKSLVDKEAQLRFFEQNPEKAAAFCAALNADPDFRWSGGTQIQPSQLRDYFAELTPMMLTRDTRVTNHGFRNGKPTPRQAVLQKGQMVLVDRYGIPRVRCECGNPLAPPKPVKKTPVYTGPKWPDFDPTTIVVVQPTTVIIEIFVVIDINTGKPFDRPFGTDGAEDMTHEVTVWQLDVAMVYDDESGHNFRTDWSGVVTLDPADGTLSGEGAGQWNVAGPYYEGEDVIGQMSGDGYFNVEISGQRDITESGGMLTIYPVMTDFTLESQAWDGPDPQGARTDFEDAIGDIISMSFDAVLELSATDEGPVLADLAVDPWVGSATLAPYEP